MLQNGNTPASQAPFVATVVRSNRIHAVILTAARTVRSTINQTAQLALISESQQTG
jgi:hypothetical protein